MLYGSVVGLLGTNIIVVNNLRDRHTDVAANKRTTAVRFGRTFSLVEFASCFCLSYAMVVVDAWRAAAPLRLLPWLSLPLAIKLTKNVFALEGQALNKYVGATAGLQFLFCILLAVGNVMSYEKLDI